MEAYGFSDAAQRVLSDTKFTVRNLRAPDGGGFWYGPEENRIELFGIQAEAAIHEMAHAWADLTGFYDEWSKDWDRWPTLNRTFRADVRRAAEEQDPNGTRASASSPVSMSSATHRRVSPGCSRTTPSASRASPPARWPIR